MPVRLHRAAALALLLAVAPAAARTQSKPPAALPRAIYTDPPHDSAHPARLAVLHIPTGGVQVNAVAYLPPGAARHPVFVLFHGFPGNEKNLDLVQAARRAGWAAIAPNYRGTWGSPGTFSFAGNLEDADAVLAWLRTPAVADSLGLDTTRIVIAGHSMGGLVVVNTASHDRRLAGAILISAADMGAFVEGMARADVVKWMASDMETLAGVTPESLADSLASGGARWAFAGHAPALAHTPLLVVTSNDGLAPSNAALVKAVRAAGNKRLTTRHLATDHSYDDARIALESAVLRWLGTVKAVR